MPKPGQILADYAFDSGNELHSLGGRVEVHVTARPLMNALTVHAKVVFGSEGAEAVLSAFEHVRIDEEGRAFRHRYNYHVTFEDDFCFRYDHDPVQPPDQPHHKHLPEKRGRRRVQPTSEVSLREVAEEIHELVQARTS